MDYYVDLLEPVRDLNKALDLLGNAVGRLYQKHWDEEQKKHYNDKPFNLNVQAFAQMWYNGDIKVFIVRKRDTNEPVGFLSGVVFRPMAYHATVFSIQDWYTGTDKEMETELFNYVSKAIRLLNCDELWVSQPGVGEPPVVPSAWKLQQNFSMRRYIKE